MPRIPDASGSSSPDEITEQGRRHEGEIVNDAPPLPVSDGRLSEWLGSEHGVVGANVAAPRVLDSQYTRISTVAFSTSATTSSNGRESDRGSASFAATPGDDSRKLKRKLALMA